MEAHAPKRYSGVSDTTQKGETKMKQETKARIRVVGRILFLVYLLALVYFLLFAEEYGRRNFLNWITVTIWCRFRKSDVSGFTAKRWDSLPHF